MKAKNQYSVVAKDAYQKIVNGGLEYEKAWDLAAKEILKGESTQKKGCPRHTFLGLCNSGDLKRIKGKYKSKSRNYQYAEFAITKLKQNSALTNPELWKMVNTKFEKAKTHNGQ